MTPHQAAGEDEAAFTLFTLRDEAWMLHMFDGRGEDRQLFSSYLQLIWPCN